MYRIGTVNIDTSHAPSFAEILLQGDVARYTAIYNDGFRTDEEVNAFMEKFGVTERYTDLAEMAKHIDIAFIQSCNWDRHIELSMPFIEAGVPVFIDKPLVGNLKDCRTLEKLAEEGKVILGTSAMRYTYERDSFFAVPDEQRGNIIHVSTMVGVDEFNYAIHSIESILGFLKSDSAVSCRYIGGGMVGDVPTDSYYVRFASGATACYHICLKGWQPSTALVMTDKTSFAYKLDVSKLYEAMLKHVCAWLEGKPNDLVSVTDMTMAVKIMLAGKKSKENGGAEVALADLCESDVGFDGYAFEEFYAESQRPKK
ncbi:MAG: Gfo/Idh/MocA family oxidoreductase [Clostridia bacterium]|nr:Gfo/Idh/MocA family oxidoreductase [Clostridia bacterium]